MRNLVLDAVYVLAHVVVAACVLAGLGYVVYLLWTEPAFRHGAAYAAGALIVLASFLVVIVKHAPHDEGWM